MVKNLGCIHVLSHSKAIKITCRIVSEWRNSHHMLSERSTNDIAGYDAHVVSLFRLSKQNTMDWVA